MGLSRLRGLCLLLTAGLVLAGCAAASSADGSPTTTTTNPSAIELENGGTVTVAVRSLPGNFNPSTPAGASATTAMVTNLVWPQPFVVDAHGERVAAVLSGGLGVLVSAEVTRLSPLEVTYVITRAARWSDGVAISAADFIYNWHEQVAHGATAPAHDPVAGYRDIAAITSSGGGHTFTVRFTKPYADWEALFANLIPAHIAQRYGWSGAFARFSSGHLISGGPFEVEKVVPGKELVLARNPHYWATPARLDRIVFRVMPNVARTIAGLADGSIDVAMLPPSRAIDALAVADPELTALTVTSPVLWQLVFNEATAPTSLLALREAVAQTIDRTQIADVSIGETSHYNEIDENHLYPPDNGFGADHDAAYLTPELSSATTLLASLGDTLGTDGLLRDPTGAPLRLTLVGPTGNALVHLVENELTAQLLQIGIGLDVHNYPAAMLLGTVLPKGEFDLALAPYPVTNTLSETAALYGPAVGASSLSAGIAAGASASATGGVVDGDIAHYANVAVSADFTRAAQQLNFIDATAIYNAIDAQLWKDLPTVPLFEQPDVLVTDSMLVNVSYSPTAAGPLWDAQDWAIQLSPSLVSTTTTTPTTVPTTSDVAG